MAVTTITKVGAFTNELATQINDNFSAVGSGGSFASPAITGTVTGGAEYTAPVLTTPTLGVATATSVNKVAITAPATSATLTIANGKTLTASNTLTLAGTDSTTMTFPTTSATIARTDAANTFTGVQTMTSPALTTPAIGAATGVSVVLSGDCQAATFHAGATAGVTAGPFTTVSSIRTVAGIVTVLTGS